MITDLFLSVFEISVSISPIIVAVLLLTPFLNKRYAAKWKYWIWVVLALRLLIPFGGADSRPAVDILPQMEMRNESEAENPYPDILPAGTARGRVVVEIPAQMTTPIAIQPEKTNGSMTLLDLAAFMWALGSLTIISVHLISYLCFRSQLIKRGMAIKDKSVLRLLRKLKSELHIKCPVRAAKYPEAASPMLTGFFRPVLILPEEHYNEEDLYFILKHELVHLKRRDIWFKLLFVAAVAVHWFNPLIWIMQKEASVDMELSCDERVTQGASYAVRKAYTETMLSTLHKQCIKRTVLSTQFYGGKQIMKKRFQNILRNTGKKNGAVIWMCSVILTVSLGTLVGCSVVKDNVEDALEQAGNDEIQPDDVLAESVNDFSVTIENVTIALYEDQQDITEKLKSAGLSYQEYDSYYQVGESLCVYFENGICVRLSLVDEIPQTARGIHKGDSYSRMIEQYGDSFEKHFYPYKELYEVYRYSWDDYVCEFGILGEISDKIHNLDLYTPDQYPIYDYGEEWTSADMERRKIEDIAYQFAWAYFDGHADVLWKFLADSYEQEIEVYEDTGTISDLTLKGLSDADDQKIENGTCVVSLEFRDSEMGDVFRYLTLEFIKQEEEWKIQFYGLEG